MQTVLDSEANERGKAKRLVDLERVKENRKQLEEQWELINQQWLDAIKKDPSGNYVYIIQDADVTGYYKIGRSREIAKRLTKFDVKLPMRIRIFLLFKVKDEVEAERLFHRLFAAKRVSGEWFNLDESDTLWLSKLFMKAYVNPQDLTSDEALHK